MKILTRIMVIICILIVFIWLPIYVFSYPVFYNGYTSEGITRETYLKYIPFERIAGVAMGDDIIASYQVNWSMIHFYKIDGTYFYTLQLPKPGNGRGSIAFYNHNFYVKQPNGTIISISTIDKSVQFWNKVDTDVYQRIENYIKEQNENSNCFERYRSIYVIYEGVEKKIVDGSVIIWFLSSNALFYCLIIMFMFIFIAKFLFKIN